MLGSGLMVPERYRKIFTRSLLEARVVLGGMSFFICSQFCSSKGCCLSSSGYCSLPRNPLHSLIAHFQGKMRATCL